MHLSTSRCLGLLLFIDVGSYHSDQSPTVSFHLAINCGCRGLLGALRIPSNLHTINPL